MFPSSTLPIRPLVATFALTAASLQAANVPNPANGDIFLGIRALAGDGTDAAYLVNLGQDSVFRNTSPGSSITLSSLGTLDADLTSKFGSNWHAREDLAWGVFGTRNSASPAVYGSRQRVSPSASSLSWPALALNGRNSVTTQILSVLEGQGGYRGRAATENITVATFQPNSAASSSYAYQVGTPGTTDFGSLSQWGSIEASSNSGISSTFLDLYRISGSTTTPVQNLGYFSISSVGLISFTAASAAPSNADSDGDGQSDSDEAVAGTNPASPTDFFRIQELQHSSSGTTIRIQTIPQRTYQIQYSPDLSNGSWVTIETHASGSGSSLYEYVDTNSTRLSAGRGFYRVVVSQ